MGKVYVITETIDYCYDYDEGNYSESSVVSAYENESHAIGKLKKLNRLVMPCNDKIVEFRDDGLMTMTKYKIDEMELK